MLRNIIFLFSFAIVMTASGALALEWAGTVKAAKGTTTVEREGTVIPLHLGDKVYPGDKLISGKTSRIAVTLRDDTLISLGADSKLTLNKFAYNASTQEGNLLVSVLRGVTAMVSGSVAKANPNAMQITTPTATAGIRGTEFIVEVDSE